MVKFKIFFNTFLFLTSGIYASTPPTGFHICEEIGSHHPFHVFDQAANQERHSTVLHIGPVVVHNNPQHHIWFLMTSITETNATVNNIETNHVTKKLIYNNGTLELIGKKSAYGNNRPDAQLKTNQFSNTIVPRDIIWAEKHETEYTHNLQIDRMIQTNKTAEFCSVLKKHYT